MSAKAYNTITRSLTTICPHQNIIDDINSCVDRRTRIGFEVAKFLTAFTIFHLNSIKVNPIAMCPIDQNTVDRAWLLLSTEKGKVLDLVTHD